MDDPAARGPSLSIPSRASTRIPSAPPPLRSQVVGRPASAPEAPPPSMIVSTSHSETQFILQALRSKLILIRTQDSLTSPIQTQLNKITTPMRLGSPRPRLHRVPLQQSPLRPLCLHSMACPLGRACAQSIPRTWKNQGILRRTPVALTVSVETARPPRASGL